jgi:hypothetical protein
MDDLEEAYHLAFEELEADQRQEEVLQVREILPAVSY